MYEVLQGLGKAIGSSIKIEIPKFFGPAASFMGIFFHKWEIISVGNEVSRNDYYIICNDKIYI